MSSWPLIARELRELSRQGQLFWIRVIAGAIAFIATTFLLLDRTFIAREIGPYVFHSLNHVLFLTVIVIGPLITADCIAREKREGTLGLLFLAPLTPRDIILSKLAMNALRAFTLLLAVLPLMALPVVFGGVPLETIIMWIFRHALALCLALSAGMLASTLYREFIQAAVVAELLCIAFLVVCFVVSGTWAPIACLGAMIIAFATLQFCSNELKDRWEKDSAGYTQPFWVRLFSESDGCRDLFRWDTRRARSRQPIAWLQEYSWSARLAKWGWCIVVVVYEFFAIVVTLASANTFVKSQLVLALALVLGIALSSANSFRTERLTGAMELFLVTPLTPFKIISGRLWGIWIHFFPAVTIFVFLWIAGAPLARVNPGEAYIMASSYVFVPMVGLFVSMLPWHVLVAWASVFVIGAIGPIYFAHLIMKITLFPALHVVICIQAILGVSAIILLYRTLRTRAFILH